MTITSAIVLFMVIWFMALLIALPLRLTTQREAGQVVPGTPESAPEVHHLARKVWIVTAVSVVLWAIIAGIIVSGWVTIHDIDILNNYRG